MNKIIKIFVIFTIIVNVINGLAFPKHDELESTLDGSGSFPAQWFTQTLDHFNFQNNQTFQQKYYVNDQYYNYQNGGPIILYINGEGPVSSPPYSSDDAVVIYAQALNCMIVTLEHRFYGESSPFSELTVENLQYLSHQQALEDLATFIVSYQNQLKNAGHIVTIGGSYSGALSAWFRIKYPHITVGSIASSGVVHAILDFTAFDSYLTVAGGPECTSALQAVTAAVEKEYFAGSSNQQHIKQILQAEELTEIGDFFYWLADSMAEGLQYGYYDELCYPLIDAINAGTTGIDLITLYSNYTINTWGKVLGTPDEYSTAWQQNITYDPSKSADRAWWYQTCSSLGWFQAAPSQNSIRSSMVNMTYFQTHCEQLFGEGIWPNVNAVNLQYGGDQSNPLLNAAGSNILFTSGFSDPWTQASILKSNYPDVEPSIMTTCRKCGHCVDLRGCPGGCDLPNNLDQVRSYSLKLIATWLNINN
ncbi:hypothetical protein RB653_009225 [Dictyostelium firmibasis]|uniref:Serine protease K12H4.7 n=1 Tax=Dictyostelium firmibasis TaxID=79012 RepID=A0AAN7YTK4_9MYCE